MVLSSREGSWESPMMSRRMLCSWSWSWSWEGRGSQSPKPTCPHCSSVVASPEMAVEEPPPPTALWPPREEDTVEEEVVRGLRASRTEVGSEEGISSLNLRRPKSGEGGSEKEDEKEEKQEIPFP